MRGAAKASGASPSASSRRGSTRNEPVGSAARPLRNTRGGGSQPSNGASSSSRKPQPSSNRGRSASNSTDGPAGVGGVGSLPSNAGASSSSTRRKSRTTTSMPSRGASKDSKDSSKESKDEMDFSVSMGFEGAVTPTDQDNGSIVAARSQQEQDGGETDASTGAPSSRVRLAGLLEEVRDEAARVLGSHGNARTQATWQADPNLSSSGLPSDEEGHQPAALQGRARRGGSELKDEVNELEIRKLHLQASISTLEERLQKLIRRKDELESREGTRSVSPAARHDMHLAPPWSPTMGGSPVGRGDPGRGGGMSGAMAGLPPTRWRDGSPPRGFPLLAAQQSPGGPVSPAAAAAQAPWQVAAAGASASRPVPVVAPWQAAAAALPHPGQPVVVPRRRATTSAAPVPVYPGAPPGVSPSMCTSAMTTVTPAGLVQGPTGVGPPMACAPKLGPQQASEIAAWHAAHIAMTLQGDIVPPGTTCVMPAPAPMMVEATPRGHRSCSPCSSPRATVPHRGLRAPIMTPNNMGSFNDSTTPRVPQLVFRRSSQPTPQKTNPQWQAIPLRPLPQPQHMQTVHTPQAPSTPWVQTRPRSVPPTDRGSLVMGLEACRPMAVPAAAAGSEPLAAAALPAPLSHQAPPAVDAMVPEGAELEPEAAGAMSAQPEFGGESQAPASDVVSNLPTSLDGDDATPLTTRTDASNNVRTSRAAATASAVAALVTSMGGNSQSLARQ